MDLEESLRHVLGLKKNESKVYEILLSNGEQDVKELQIKSALPQSRIYEVLKTLEIKGLVKGEKRGNQPKTYIAQDPSLAFSRLIAKEKDNHMDKVLKLEQLSSYLHDVWKDRVNQYLEGSLMTLDFEDAESLLIEDISLIEDRLFIAVSSRRSLIDWKKSTESLRNVLFKEITVMYLIKDQTLVERLRKRFEILFFGSECIEVAANPDLKLSFIILDNCIYLTLFGETATMDAKVIRSTNRQLVDQFVWIFNALWSSSG